MTADSKKITTKIETVNKAKPPKVVLPWWVEEWQKDKDKLNEIKTYIEGWFKQINCDGKQNHECYMLCSESNICTMFNEILEKCNS